MSGSEGVDYVAHADSEAGKVAGRRGGTRPANVDAGGCDAPSRPLRVQDGGLCRRA